MTDNKEREAFEAWFEDWQRSTWKPLESDQRREMPEHWGIAYKRNMKLAFQAAAALAASQEKAEPVGRKIGYIKIGTDGCPRAQLTTSYDAAGNVWADATPLYAAPVAAQADMRECRHCGWMCAPNDAKSKRWYPLSEPVAAHAAHPDDAAVDRFAVAMKEKLAIAREKGRSGWEKMDPAELSLMLREHVEKGDPRDVANFCMFLWALGEPIGAMPVAAQASEPVAVVGSGFALHWVGSGPITPIVERYGISVGSFLYTAPQPSAEAVRDAAYETAADVAMKAPITSGMADDKSAQALAFHASARIRALKSAPPQPAEQASASPAALTDEQIAKVIREADGCGHIQLITATGEPTFVARKIVAGVLARAQGEQA